MMRRPRRNRLGVALGLAVAGMLAIGAVVYTLPGRGVIAPAGETRMPARPETIARAFARYFHAGVESLRIGRPGDAAAMFEAARKLRPRVPEVHVNLGFAAVALGQHAAAAAAFSEAIALRPGQANAYYGLAESLMALGDTPRALGAMRHFLHLSRADDRFRRQAMAAVWEIEAKLAQERGQPQPADDHGSNR